MKFFYLKTFVDLFVKFMRENPRESVRENISFCQIKILNLWIKYYFKRFCMW